MECEPDLLALMLALTWGRRSQDSDSTSANCIGRDQRFGELVCWFKAIKIQADC